MIPSKRLLFLCVILMLYPSPPLPYIQTRPVFYHSQLCTFQLDTITFSLQFILPFVFRLFLPPARCSSVSSALISPLFLMLVNIIIVRYFHCRKPKIRLISSNQDQFIVSHIFLWDTCAPGTKLLPSIIWVQILLQYHLWDYFDAPNKSNQIVASELI